MNFDEEAMKIRRGKHGIIETIPREVLKTHDDLSILIRRALPSRAGKSRKIRTCLLT